MTYYPANKIYNQIFIIVIVFCYLGILWVSFNTDLFVGDETWHIRLARDIYNTNSRPLEDQLVHKSKVSSTFRLTDVFWHYGLVYFWKFFNKTSIVLAQIYNSFYLLLLICGVFFVAKKLYGDEIAKSSIFLLLSMPTVPAFTIIMHTDIAVAALFSIVLLAILKKRYFLSGILFGITHLIKRNSLFVLPSVLILILFSNLQEFMFFIKEGYTFKKNVVSSKLINLCYFIFAFVIVILPDSIFRVTHFTWQMILPIESLQFKINSIFPFKDNTTHIKYIFYDSLSPLYDKLAYFKFFGLSIFILLAVYFVKGRNKRSDFFILSIIIIAVINFLICGFLTGFILRYLVIIIPVIAILGAKGLKLINNKLLKGIILSICFIQFIGTLVSIYKIRKIPAGLKEGYEYVIKNTDISASIMTPLSSQLSYYTNRISHWSSYCCLVESNYLFWKANEEEARKIFDRYGTNYMLVEQQKIYDDKKIRHLGGYPSSFLNKIKHWDNFQLIYKNNEVELWKIK